MGIKYIIIVEGRCPASNVIWIDLLTVLAIDTEIKYRSIRGPTDYITKMHPDKVERILIHNEILSRVEEI